MLKKVKGEEFFKLRKETKMYFLVELEDDLANKIVADAIDDGLIVYEAEDSEPDKKKNCNGRKKSNNGLTDSDIGKIKALFEGGWPKSKIAKELKVSVQTVYNYVKKFEAEGIVPREKAEITQEDEILTHEHYSEEEDIFDKEAFANAE